MCRHGALLSSGCVEVVSTPAVLLYISVVLSFLFLYFFFFFQAEDGIRDLTVTGVQTCALPISDDGPAGRCIRRPGGAAAGNPAAPPAGRVRRPQARDCTQTRPGAPADRRAG